MRARLVELVGVAEERGGLCRAPSRGWGPAPLIMVLVAVTALLKLAPAPVVAEASGEGAQTPTASADTAGPVPRTPWGEPDLQGIWTEQFDTPLQRPARFANKEFFTDEERAQLDKQRAALLSRDRRVERGTELDVAGAYNAVFLTFKRTGRRTSLISDPPNGRMPPLTQEAQNVAAAEREFRLALLQSTETCKNKSVACAGGKYDPTPSPKRAALPPRYNTARMNRHDNPEDGALPDRCLTGGLPEFGTAFGGSYRRIVQTPGGISMFYDVGQGQGWQRNIVMNERSGAGPRGPASEARLVSGVQGSPRVINGTPHLPASIRQWYGDSRGRWEGDTLVIDVTNFSPKTDYQGSRENLHLVERWTRTGPNTLEYAVTIEDPTVWTRPWTVKQEFTKQSDQANRIYYEPRCYEGNYGFPSLMLSARMEDLAFAEGRGPDPAAKDNATDFVGVEENPLQ